MTHASLFSGIGGFDLAAEWAGWTNVFHCEIDPFCRSVLKYHFPNATQYEDIRTTDFTAWRGRVDVLTGGFPCQPFSIAGKRLGTSDERYLWPEMLRAIREIRPRWVVGENVRGFINWSEGLVLETVCADLEALGYEVQPFVLPACAVGAPHRRDRVWIVAHRADTGIEGVRGREELADRCEAVADAPCVGCGPGRTASNGSVQNAEIRANLHVPAERSLRERPAADADSSGLQGGINQQQQVPQGIEGNTGKNSSGCDKHGWECFPTQPPVRGKYDGISLLLDRYITPEVYGTISKTYGNKDLSKVRQAFSKTEIWEQIRGLFEISEKEVLFKTMQLLETGGGRKDALSSFSKETSERILRKLRKYREFGCTPQGQKYQKQFERKFGNTLPHLSYEIALAAKTLQEECLITRQSWRQQSIKAYGNAIVPHVFLQIAKTINNYEKITIE